MLIGGDVREDVNGNGKLDENDPSHNGVVIELDIDSDGTVDQSTTASQGKYRFSICASETNRTFTVRQNLAKRPGWVQTTADITPQTIQAADSLDNNFGSFRLGSLAGYFFNDANGNRVDDGEPRLLGVPIALERDRDLDGTIDETIESKTSSTDGTYSFEDLGPGRYWLRERIAAGVLSRPQQPILMTSRSAYMAIAGQEPVAHDQVAKVGSDFAIGVDFPPEPAWHNHTNPNDVDESGTIFPRDVLLVINELHRRQVSDESTADCMTG